MHTCTSSLSVASRSARITRSRVRAPTMDETRTPRERSSRASGNTAPVPKPPPISTAWPSSGSGAARPSGPAKSRNVSPTCSAPMSALVCPTSWTTIVIVPAARLKSVMLIGTRSPVSVTRRITNWPGAALRATSGAWTTNSLVMSVRSRFSMIRAVVSMVTHRRGARPSPYSRGFSSLALSRCQRRSHLGLDRCERRLVAGLAEVLGLAHQLQPVGDRHAPPDRLRVVGDAGDAALDFVQREEAGVDRGLDDLDADAVLGLPVQRAGDQHLAVGRALHSSRTTAPWRPSPSGRRGSPRRR